MIDNLIRLLQSEYQRQIDNEDISFTSYTFNYVHDIFTEKFTNNLYAINTLETLIENCNDNNLTLIYSSILLGINLNNRQAIQAILDLITSSREKEIIGEALRCLNHSVCNSLKLETEFKNLIDALINLMRDREYLFEARDALDKIARGNSYAINSLTNLIIIESNKNFPNTELIAQRLFCLKEITNISQKTNIIPILIQLLSDSRMLDIFNSIESFIVGSFSNNTHIILPHLERVFDNYQSKNNYQTQIIILKVAKIINNIDQGNEVAFNSVVELIGIGQESTSEIMELVLIKAAHLLLEINPDNTQTFNIYTKIIERSQSAYNLSLVAEYIFEVDSNNILAINKILSLIQHPTNGDSILIALDNICKINVNISNAIQVLIELMTRTRTLKREYYGVPASNIFNKALYTLGEIAINTDDSVAINFLLNLLEISDYRKNEILKSLKKIVVNSNKTIEYLVIFINDCESRLLNFYREYENRSILNEWLEEISGGVVYSPQQKALLEFSKIREFVNTINKIVEYGSYDLKQYTIRLIINLISSVEDEDVIQLLEKTLLDIFITTDINTMSWIVSYSKQHLSQEEGEDYYNRFAAFFTIVWQCAQNLPFSIFHQAWNNSLFTQNIPLLENNGFRDYPEESIEDMMNTVYLLLTDNNNNIYSIQSGDQEIALMFESKNDATGYASLIERKNYPSYSVQAYDGEGIKEIFKDNGCQWQLITEGMPISLPEDNTEQLDLNPESNYQTSPTSLLDSSQIMQVYILLYNPNTQNEGIHTIQTGNQDTVLMFESEEEATDYALRLEAQKFPQPSVELIDRDEIEQWCTSAGYQWRLITEGMSENPAVQNVEQLDLNPESNYPISSQSALIENQNNKKEEKGVFDIYTDKAINAIMLAQEESKSSKCDYLGTEHLLLGLIAEGTDIAAKILRSKGIKLKTARLKVKEIFGEGSSQTPQEIPFTPRCEEVFNLSQQEAKSLGNSQIETGHILLALTRMESGVGIEVLKSFDLDLEELRTEIITLITSEKNAE